VAIVDSEQVLVVPAAEFHRLGHFQGVSTDVDRYLRRLLTPEVVSYRPRGEMERDPSFKQLIPYVIFQYDDPQGTRWLFGYTRGSGQGETRLHSKLSIGIGGHIAREDAGDDGERNPYHEGMRRELDEEVIILTPYEDRCVGVINDDETDVGKVHLGIVHVFAVERPDVRPRETEMHSAGFQPLETLRGQRDRMESWSQICLDALYGDVPPS
jgi:predicted NUDIX family phosphoesterase